MRLRIKSTTLTMKIIGWFQIVGGVLGLAAVASLMLNTGEVSGGLLLIFLIGTSLFIFSIYAGRHLLITDNPAFGLIMSLINQSFQLFQWKILGWGMLYAAGTQFSVGVGTKVDEGSKGFLVNFNFKSLYSEFEFAIMSGDDFRLRINLVALLILIVLADILKERKQGHVTPIQIG
jgi:hypothetical protein